VFAAILKGSSLAREGHSGKEDVVGYFSNGSEGADYEARYCSKCVHINGPDGKSGCAVWLLHLISNYEDCNNAKSPLHVLIPLSKNGLYNEQCSMFHKGKARKES
jgi:hypothetical protein